MNKGDLFFLLVLFAFFGLYNSLYELRQDIINGYKPWRTLDEIRRTNQEA